MPSLLIVSSDPQVSDPIEQAALRRGIRTRSVAALASAEQWLDLQPYDMIIVDARYATAATLRFFQRAWKQAPLTVGAIYESGEANRDALQMRLQGAHLLTGENAMAEVERMLDVILDSHRAPNSFPILVVEDLDSPRDIICAYIESLGYAKVDGAKSATEALSRLRAEPGKYCCVITDINMPEVKGTELIRTIRDDAQLAHLPVIALTAYATPENLIDCIKAGATGFLVKPPRKKNLKDELEKARRIVFNRQSPRLCRPEEADVLEEAILRLAVPS